jgi:hypothetical protein
MSIRNIKAANQTEALTVNGIPYTLARSEVFYYLKFIDYDKELFKDTSNLTAKPTVIFYTENAQNKVILDYSLANQTDQTYLSSFFANMTQVDTFGLTLGNYLDKSELEANVGCNLLFDEFKENKIFARVTSVTNQNPALDVYFGEYFIGTPQLTKSGSLGSATNTINYALISVNPSTNKPLSSLGMIVGDLIEVVNTQSDNNQIKFEITEITTINDKEVLKIKPITNDIVPTLESLLGYSSLLNVYVKGTTSLTQQLSGDLGCCYGNGVKIENNTEYQCSIRENFEFSSGTCDSITTTTNATQVPVPLIINTYDTAADVQSSDVIFNSYISYTNEKTPALKLSITTGDVAYLQDYKISLTATTKYCFSQQDVSNLNHTIRFSSTKDTYTPYTSGIYGGVRSVGVNSNQFLDTNTYSYPTLYIYLESKNLISKGVPATTKTNYYISL